MPEFGIFIVHLFDDAGLDFGDLLILLLQGLLGSKRQVPIGVRCAVPVVGETVSAGISVMVVGVKSFLEFFHFLLMFFDFLEFVLPFDFDFGLKSVNFLSKSFKLCLNIENDSIFVFD